VEMRPEARVGGQCAGVRHELAIRQDAPTPGEDQRPGQAPSFPTAR
jgi:hypothetical protein